MKVFLKRITSRMMYLRAEKTETEDPWPSRGADIHLFVLSATPTRKTAMVMYGSFSTKNAYSNATVPFNGDHTPQIRRIAIFIPFVPTLS
ncbi:hypothetical protein AC482_07355 [miscellaneous Crenarchaeota group-15 archaeon DG-45]|uniref:Uncharacterized protein n=1 Tax=miscellaneous Crenarchaeota group-15 archaeon DG-45 TaxID=1685127 RepID=A0A0M0BK85_9ARCH|nr:MAG: hypothetical protein AC482_07355 [miscellaneous Crenarchaeota group-15 archaeon DG-45]